MSTVIIDKQKENIGFAPMSTKFNEFCKVNVGNWETISKSKTYKIITEELINKHGDLAFSEFVKFVGRETNTPISEVLQIFGNYLQNGN